MEDKIKTNVVFFTTTCNLACTYCYQHLKDYPHKETSKKELMEIVDRTIEREGYNSQTLFILFGGEPTTRWENVEFFMNYAYFIKKDVQFNIVTNGIKFKDDKFLKKFISNIHYKEGRLKLEISFDGVEGNSERIYPNGKNSTKDVVEVLFKLKEINTNYRIRYTVHKKNVKFFENDILKIMKYFKPERIILSEYENDLSSDELKHIEKIKNILIKKYYNNEIDIPICMKYDEMCKVCGKCEDKHIEEFSINLGSESMIQKKITFDEFDTFNELT